MGPAMNRSDTAPLTASQIQQIEERARALRAQAFTGMLRSLFRTLFSAPRKVISCPACARPLHG